MPINVFVYIWWVIIDLVQSESSIYEKNVYVSHINTEVYQNELLHVSFNVRSSIECVLKCRKFKDSREKILYFDDGNECFCLKENEEVTRQQKAKYAEKYTLIEV